jgi:hypothetical protein
MTTIPRLRAVVRQILEDRARDGPMSLSHRLGEIPREFNEKGHDRTQGSAVLAQAAGLRWKP